MRRQSSPLIGRVRDEASEFSSGNGKKERVHVKTGKHEEGIDGKFDPRTGRERSTRCRGKLPVRAAPKSLPCNR
jgi:hypothetical protein